MRAKAARSWIARTLAVLAVAASALVIYLVISGSLDGSGDDGRKGKRAGAERPNREQSSQPEPEQETYTVQEGDTLSGIAVKTGVPVERIADLNPELDPQSLSTGQVVKLR